MPPSPLVTIVLPTYNRPEVLTFAIQSVLDQTVEDFELLAVAVADTESEATWQDVFSSLKARGLTGVRLVTSDHHAGIRKAVKKHFQGASWQRC